MVTTIAKVKQSEFEPGMLKSCFRKENSRTSNKKSGYILGLSEVRWQGAGKITSSEFTIVYSGGDSHQRRVCKLIDAECSKALTGLWGVNDRLIVMKISGKPFDIGIIQDYAPTADKDLAEIESFYKDIEKEIKQL